MNIRPYHAADLEMLMQLINPHIPENFAPEEKEDFEQYLNNEVEQYFVLEMDKRIVACGGINFFPIQKEARISWDMVDKNQMGKGIGAVLLQHRIEKINQMQEINTIVVRTSQQAYLFYQKHGFQLISIQKDFWAPGLDLYYMQMENSIARK